MRTERIYIETSLINRIADPLDRDAAIRREQLASREWWPKARRNPAYILVTSKLAVGECMDRYKDIRVIRLRRRIFSSRIVAPVPYSRRDAIAALLSGDKLLLPATEFVDAPHIANAVPLGCQHLLTWNQTHLTNPYIAERVHNTLESHGYPTPTIATPTQFQNRRR
jgi:hypothetical protein